MAQTDSADWYYNYPLNVRYGEVGSNGQSTLFSLANWLQEAAGQSASHLGFGEEAMSPLGLGWILTRLVLRIQRLPAPHETLRVRTWPSGLGRFGQRGYEVYDATDKLIISGGSAWTVMDLSSRTLATLPPKLSAAYPAQPPACDAFTCRVLPRLSDETLAEHAPIRVRQDDLDLNGHVNNARYLSWLMEALPSPLFRSARQGRTGQEATLRLVDITFRAECFPGDELVSLAAPHTLAADSAENVPGMAPVDNPHALVHAIRTARATPSAQPTPKAEDVCRAISLWSGNPFTC